MGSTSPMLPHSIDMNMPHLSQ
jgi:hypothetical protein